MSLASGRHRRAEPLGTGWLTVTVVIGIMAALIAIGGMVLSFRAVSTEMIPAFGARWAWLVPIVVDLTVLVFSGVDLVLARLDMSHPLARWTVYGATGGTVWLNYSAGGDTAGRVAHVLMPSIWVMFIELMRHVVRRQANLATGTHREPIPAARWLLSPWPTLKLWRRMVLWQIRSYPRALDQEKQRLAAVAVARSTYGRLWRSRISPLTRLEINLGEIGPDRIDPTRLRSTAPDNRPDYRESGHGAWVDPTVQSRLRLAPSRPDRSTCSTDSRKPAKQSARANPPRSSSARHCAAARPTPARCATCCSPSRPKPPDGRPQPGATSRPTRCAPAPPRRELHAPPHHSRARDLREPPLKPNTWREFHATRIPQENP